MSWPPFTQTNKSKGGLKFLLPAFKAHGRNSWVIEGKGERESWGWAKGWKGRASPWMLESGFTIYTRRSCIDLDWVWSRLSMCLFSCQHHDSFVILRSPGPLEECVQRSVLQSEDKSMVLFVPTSLRSYFKVWTVIECCSKWRYGLGLAWATPYNSFCQQGVLLRMEAQGYVDVYWVCMLFLWFQASPGAWLVLATAPHRASLHLTAPLWPDWAVKSLYRVCTIHQ